MKKSTKAVLLSAFVFPGAGHFFLKKYISAVVLVGASFSGIYLLIVKTVERALQITEKIQSGDIRPDVAAIAEIISKQPTGTEAQLLKYATAVLVICWLIGIIDSYRVGCVRDKNDWRCQIFIVAWRPDLSFEPSWALKFKRMNRQERQVASSLNRQERQEILNGNLSVE